MTLIESFADWLATETGQSVYITKASEHPSTNLWVRSAGGSLLSTNVNGGQQFNKVIEIYYRDANSKTVAEKLEQISDDLTCTSCLSLNGYNIIESLVSGPYTDQDKDEQSRTIGLLQLTITIYKENS